MTDIALLGIKVDSSPATKAAKELDVLAVSAGRADVASEKLATTSGRKMAPAMSAGGHQSRMMAQQLSQVAQQASATGNWVQALAIQLPDMALGFGAAGIAAGVLAGVALPLLASAFMSTSGEAEAVAKALEELDSAAQAYIAAADAAGASTDELAAKYGRLAVEARLAFQALSDVALIDAMTAADLAIAGVADSLLRIQVINKAGATGVFLAEDFGLAKDAADQLIGAIQALESANGLEAQARAATEVQRQLLAAFGSVEKMPAPIRAAYAEMARIAISAGEVNARASAMEALLRAAAGAASAAAAAVGGIGSAASNAYGAVSSLVSKMWEMGEARAAYSESVGGGRGASPGGPALDPYGFRAQLERGAAGSSPSGGGTGGGGADPYATDLQALIENLASERSIEDEWYQENLAILQDRRAVEIMGKEAHDAAMVSLHEEYQRRIAEIDAAAQQQRLGDTANLFGALASIAQAGGQRMAKTAATFGAIEATINAYKAATAALAAPNLTLAGRFAAYASVLGAGLKGVAAIRAAGGIGGGSGGGSSGIAAQGATAPAGQNIEYRVYGLERDAVYSGAFIEKIFAGLMEEGKRRGLNTQTVQFV
jgi:hypothetical protein